MALELVPHVVAVLQLDVAAALELDVATALELDVAVALELEEAGDDKAIGALYLR